MYVKEIKEMINLMNENNLTELEIEREGLRIKLKKGIHGITEEVVQELPAAVKAKGVSREAAAQESLQANLAQIKSPMVGTFYRAPAPDAPPFVKVGDNIEVGQVVCIIEAMKLMNEIKSEVRGRVAQILAEDADPVEFGQGLFFIEPA